MAIKKVKYHPAGTGHADINHFETDDTMVLMTAGGTLAANIAASGANYVRNPAYGPATGAVNAYTFSAMAAAALVDGMSVYLDNVIAANTGAATFNWSGLGAKAIVDAKGAALIAGKMPLNCIVGLRYNASTSSFQLLGEGGEYGTALNSDVLNTKTLGTAAGVVAGTMPNNASPATTLTTQGATKVVPAGYNPGGTITATLTNLAAAVVKDATVVGGVTGTYDHEATNPITAGDVVSPHVGFVNGTQITGTVVEKVGSATVITPSGADQAIPAGRYGGAVGDGKVLAVVLGPQIYNNAGTYSFTVPSGVTQIFFEATGGGGGGGSGGNSNLGGSGAGGGGGAGCYTDFLTVTPGEVLTVIVGAGGNPGSNGGSGSAGGDSSVKANYGRGGGGGNGGAGGVGGGGNGGNGGGYYARSGNAGGQYAGAGGTSGGRIASGNGGAGSAYGANSMGLPGTIGNKGYVQIFI